MYIKSSSDQPKVPECNAYEALWNRHEQAGCPDDFVLHIEDASGRERTYQEFRTRVVLAATALDESLGVRSENGEMIAIISHSSSVRVKEFLSTGDLSYSLLLPGQCCSRPFPASSCQAVRLV